MEDYDFDINDGFAPEDIPESLPYRPPLGTNGAAGTDGNRQPYSPPSNNDARQTDDTDDDEAVLLEETRSHEVKRKSKPARTAGTRAGIPADSDTSDRADRPAERQKSRTKSQKKSAKIAGPTRPNFIIRFITDERTHIFLGITFLLTSVLDLSYTHLTLPTTSRV